MQIQKPVTGGYGIVARSFGLTCDYVEGFEIILADGSIHTIWKPKRYDRITTFL